jgi:hypothetical protein
MPELLLAAEELATEEEVPLPELLELLDVPEAPPAPVVAAEVAVPWAVLDVVPLPLPSALPPAPPTPVPDSSSWDPFAQAEAMTTQAEAIKNRVAHPARPIVLRRLRAMLMSP